MECEVVILTLSEKWGKKCVAAYDLQNSRLVRLVSEPSHGGGIPNYLTSSISLLDIVRIKIIAICPIEHQTENVLIDLAYGLKKTGRTQRFESFFSLIKTHSSVFGNNRYKLNDASCLNHSLVLIKFNNMIFFENDKQKTKVNFIHNGIQHTNYSVTDSRFFGNQHPIHSGYAIISLPPSDTFTRDGGGYFKYVSAIY